MSSKDRHSILPWFVAGMAIGTTVALLAVARSGRGRQVAARAGEAKKVAEDAADVLRRGRRLKRPLSESERSS